MPRPALESTLWFVAVGLVAFFSVLFLGQCYDSNDLLFQFAPWRHFLRESLFNGILPLWNPHSFCGQPFFADLQNQILYPPNWPTLLPSIQTGMGWFTVLHWFIACFGMRSWLRSLELSEGASRIGALLFACSGFFWWEVIHPPVLAAFAWVPWWFSSLEKGVRQPTIRAGWWCGAAYAMLFLAGSFQVSLGAAYLGVLYAALRFWKRPADSLQPSNGWTRQLLPFFAALLLGASLLFLQLSATQTFSKWSIRENAGKNYDQFNGYWSLQPTTLGQFLFPRLGLPHDKPIESAIQEVTGDGGQKASADNIGNDYLANFGYLGIWLPLLAFFAFREKNRGLAILLSSLAALSLLLCFGKFFFLHPLLCSIAPGFDVLRAPFRFQYLYVLCASALAAMGYQALTRDPSRPEETRFRRTLVASYAGLGLLFCLTDLGQCWRELFALLVGAAGWILILNPSRAKVGRLLSAIALVGPLLLSGWGDFSVHPASNLDLEKSAPWLEQVKAKAGGDRLWLDQELPIQFNTGHEMEGMPVPTNATCVWGLKTPTGYNPLQIKEFSEIQPFLYRSPVVFSKLTAMPWFFFTKDRGAIPGFHSVQDNQLFVYSADEPRPAAYAPLHWSVEADSQHRLMAMSDPTFDPYLTSFLDAPLEKGALPSFDTPPSFSATLISETPNRQTWQVLSSSDLISVFTDSFYPGWVSRVDGTPTTILKANHGFRAIAIPAGHHQVDFTFEPKESRLLIPAAILWFLLGIALLFWTRKPTLPAKRP